MDIAKIISLKRIYSHHFREYTANLNEVSVNGGVKVGGFVTLSALGAIWFGTLSQGQSDAVTKFHLASA